MKIIVVLFQNSNQKYNYTTNLENLEINDRILVPSEKFQYIATIVDIYEQVKEKKELKKVIRKATKKDLEKLSINKKEAAKAFQDCKEKIRVLKLKMNLIDATFSFDKKQLLFNFTADNRVDFRDLVKELAKNYKTRIELRQIGVRDKARNIGGIGPCGQILCCNKYLYNFNTVSISMAKNQNLSLNPNKINGVCGRLLCCLTYENENYKEMQKGMPKIGKKYETKFGKGKVIHSDLANRLVKVYVEGQGVIEVEIPSDGSNK